MKTMLKWCQWVWKIIFKKSYKHYQHAYYYYYY